MFQYLKWPYIKQIIQQSGHNGDVRTTEVNLINILWL